MAENEPAPALRNFAAWGAIGAVVYIVAVLASAAILHQDAVASVIRSPAAAAMVGFGLVLASAVAGFTSRKRTVSLRNVRNFAVRDAAVISLFLLLLWGVSAWAGSGARGAMGASELVAAVTGTILVVVAILGIFVLTSAHTRIDFIDDEVAADELRERGRLFLCSFLWVAASGLLLVVLGLAGPGGLLSPAAALGIALALAVALFALGIAARRLTDELGRTLSRETGHIAFYLILALGGGWAILAHLGFVAGPAPLDWLTLIILLMFAASFIALGRRKLLTR